MRILICGVSSALGGMERRIEAETKLLTSLGHEVLVASSKFPELESWKSDIEKAGGRYINWRPYKFIERMQFAAPFRWLALSTLPALKREKIDFAHIALPWNFVGISMAYVLSVAGIPFVIGVHCKLGQKKELPGHARHFVTMALSKLIAVYGVSEPVSDSFDRLYSGLLPVNTTIDSIQNGIDVSRFAANAQIRIELRQRLGLEATHFAVIFCGRINQMKRPLLAVKAFAQFALQYPDARLLVVGDGAEMALLKAEVSAQCLAEKVIFAGQVPDTSPYYAASDCYLSTSKNEEGYSLATAEALASGLTAVVPNDDVFDAVYGQCLAVSRCSPADSAAYAAALLSFALCDHAQRQDYSQSAMQFANTHLSTELMDRKLTEFYKKNLY